MGDEIKISVIATGFDENYGAAKLYGNNLSRTLTMNPVTSQSPAMSDDSTNPPTSASVSDTQITPSDTTPTFNSPTTQQNDTPTEPVEDEFDIPAFLRRR
jgi:hypothetical protein